MGRDWTKPPLEIPGPVVDIFTMSEPRQMSGDTLKHGCHVALFLIAKASHLDPTGSLQIESRVCLVGLHGLAKPGMEPLEQLITGTLGSDLPS